MTITFKPLWKLLIDKEMTKEDLRISTGLSAATIAKMGKDGNVTTEVLSRVCATLQVNIDDICEVVEKSTDDTQESTPTETKTPEKERSADGN